MSSTTRTRVSPRLSWALVVVVCVVSVSGCEGFAALRSGEPAPGVYGVFEGRVPCADCERIKIRLTLFEDPVSRHQSTYTLERIHVGKSDDRAIDRGTWQTTVGAPTDADAIVVALDPGAPPEFNRYQHVGRDILLVLDGAGRPRVGDASGSFTLSRTG